MYTKIIIFLVILSSFSCMSNQDKSFTEPKYKNGNLEKLIMPFKSFSYKADYHVIAYFDGHNEYESVEAFIFKADDGFNFRAIMTNHNKYQVDYLSSNFLETNNGLTTKISREIKTTTGEFHLSNDGKNYDFSFKLDKDVTISIHYQGLSEPNGKFAGITDPGKHSPEGGIPMMYRSLSSMGNNECYVKINNKRYSITEDEEVSKKPFFTAYKAYLTKGFYFSLIPSYESNEVLKKSSFDDKILINETRFGIEKIHVNEKNEIAKIGHFGSSINGSEDPIFTMEFEQPFPNLAALENDQQLYINFSISFKGSSDKEIWGNIEIVKDAMGRVSMFLLPEYPIWAKNNRNMKYDIIISKDEANIKSVNFKL